MRNVLLVICLFILFPFLLNAQWAKYDTTNSKLPSNGIYDLEVDKNNNVWISTNKGLVKYEGNDFTVYDESNSIIKQGNILDLYLDNEDNLWILYYDKIFKHSNNNFEIIDSTKGGKSIVVDDDKNIWLGGNYSLFKRNYNEENWVEIYTDSTPNRGPVFEILNNKNNIWFRYSLDGEIFKIVNDSVINFTQSHPDQNLKSISDISLDSNSNIWVGSQDGILKMYNNITKEWENYDYDTIPELNQNSYIRDIEFDQSNNLYFTSNNRAYSKPTYLYKYLQGKFENYKLDSLMGDSFYYITSALTIDQNNNVWIGTSNSGLIKYIQGPNSVEQLSEYGLKIYPNPATTSLNIELDEDYTISEYKVIDLKGVELLKSSGYFSANQCIDIEELPQGIYIIELKTSSGEIVREKFVKY